jgi:hypothetical protein
VGFADEQVMGGTSSSGGLGLVQSDAVVGRNVVAGPTLFAAETSAAWSDMSSTSICAKASNGVVISWNDKPSVAIPVQAGWAQACLGTGWVAQTATTSNWGHINGKDGLPATGYGGDGSVISIPGMPGVFAYTTFLKKNNSDTATDVVLATSIDGGQTFHVQSVFNEVSDGFVDRPILVADPGATDGTIYLAWAEGPDEPSEVIRFRKAHVAVGGGVALDPSSPVAGNPPGHFMLAVKHGFPNTVFLAFSDFSQHQPCTLMPHAVNWFGEFTQNDGMAWQNLHMVDTDPNAPRCVQPATNDGYVNGTRPALIYSPQLDQVSMIWSKVEPGTSHFKLFEAHSSGTSGMWSTPTKVHPEGLVTALDLFRPAFASFPTGSPPRFGLSWLASDASGNVHSAMTASADPTNWTGPLEQLSSTTWVYSGFAGDYAGMAANNTNDFWATWAFETTSGQQEVLTAEETP